MNSTSPRFGVRNLTRGGNPDLAGNETANFKPAQPFNFLASN